MTGQSAPTGTPPPAESTLLAAPPSDASELLGPFRRRQSEISPRRGVMCPSELRTTTSPKDLVASSLSWSQGYMSSLSLAGRI
jgi:hypothetical protein